MNRDWTDFIRFCIDDGLPQPPSAADLDWEMLADMMKKQSLSGVMMRGLNKLTGVKVPKRVLLKTYAVAEKISKKNALMNELAATLVEQYTRDGFDCCILKGQGNTLHYPDPMMRTPGDIDIWMKPKGTVMASDMDRIRQEVAAYLRQQYRIEDTRYYHIEYHVGKIPVEAHFMPGIMNNPIYNRRLQQYYSDKQDEQCAHLAKLPGGEAIPVPTAAFNLIFQLSHMMHHFFDEGIGLRQMMDYYFLLKNEESGNIKPSVAQQLDYLGLRRFAGGVMFVLQEVFGLEEKYLITPVDRKRGVTLLHAIHKGGNFGKYSGLTQHGTGSKYLLKNWKNLKLVTEYPAEALAEPLFRTYHFFWRKKNG